MSNEAKALRAKDVEAVKLTFGVEKASMADYEFTATQLMASQSQADETAGAAALEVVEHEQAAESNSLSAVTMVSADIVAAEEPRPEEPEQGISSEIAPELPGPTVAPPPTGRTAAQEISGPDNRLEGLVLPSVQFIELDSTEELDR